MTFSEFTSPSLGNSARHSALLLHAMSLSDRKWVLSRLPLYQQKELTTLVAELEALGISPDASVLSEVLSDSVPSPDLLSPDQQEAFGATHLSPLRPVLSDADFLMALDDVDLNALAKSWRSEPPGLVAMAIGLKNWPWKRKVLVHLPALPRRRVEDLLEVNRVQPDSDTALSRALMSQMRACCESARLVLQDSSHTRPAELRLRWKSQLFLWVDAVRRKRP